LGHEGDAKPPKYVSPLFSPDNFSTLLKDNKGHYH
jgi:hypothetical protein